MTSFVEQFNLPSQTFSSCNILIMGDSGVGKSTYSNRMTTGEFLDNPSNCDRTFYLSTLGERGRTKFAVTFLDCPSNPQDVDSSIIHRADALILMFDLDNPESLNNLPIWYNKFVEHKPQAPIVLVGNKCDLAQQQVGSDAKTALLEATKRLYTYYDLSVKSNYNFEKPVLQVLRLLKSDPNIRLVETN
nr:Ran-like GTP binding protein [Pithovirus mammoth]